MKKALLVEDEIFALEDLRDSLLEIVPDLEITGVQTATEALEALARDSFDVIFLDIELPGMSGIQMLERLRPPQPPVVLVTAHALLALDAFGLGVVECLLKPVDQQRLRRAVERIQARQAEAEPQVVETGYIDAESRVFARSGDRTWLIKVGEISRIIQEDAGLRVFFRKENGLLDHEPGDFYSRMHDLHFVPANARTMVNIESVEYFTRQPNGEVVATFLDGGEVRFDADKATVLHDQYGV